MSKTTSLPSISQLISESWETTKGSWWGMVRVWLLMLGAQIVLFLIGLIAVVALGVQSKLFEALANNDTAALGTLFQNFGVPVAVITVAWLVVSLIISLAGQVASLRMVYDYKEKPGARDMFKDSFKYVGPMLILGLIGVLMVLGGFFALIIPGIIFSFLFAFSGMELVFNNQSPLAALKRSVSLVSSHFGDVFLRWLVIVGISILVSIVFAMLGDTRSPGVHGVVTLLSMVVNYVVMFFSIAYGITLYRHMAAAGVKKESNLMWMIVVAVIGWVIGGFLIMSAVTWLRSDAAQNLFNSMGPNSEEQMMENYLDDDMYEYEDEFKQLEKELNETTGSLPASPRTRSY
jgi:hypothetical protein